jgi:TolA-binding protein/predicted RNA-binding Zn-ribbon protein involved in translation (DUF1610 family)
MTKFCTSCGGVLKEPYKFCPQCGAQIRIDENDVGDQNKKEFIGKEGEIKVVVCDNCGDENLPDSKICRGCGVLLNRNAILKVVPGKEASFPERISKKSVNPSELKKKDKKKKIKPAPKQEIKNNSKEIDSKKIYLIALVITIFVLVILFTSGVFDSDVTDSSGINTGNNQPTGSGIDLNSLQKINDLEARVNANPDDLALVLELAHLKNDSGFYENAITLYQRYLDKKPENADARIDMGVCYFNIGNYDTAISEMKKALEYQPKHQIGHLNLGVVNLRAGNIDEAKSWFKKTIELGPDTEIGKKAKELLNSHNL